MLEPQALNTQQIDEQLLAELTNNPRLRFPLATILLANKIHKDGTGSAGIN